MLVHWVWLAHRPGLNDWTRWRILQLFGDPEAVYFADDYSRVEDLSRDGLKALQDKGLAGAEKILEQCFQARISVLTIQDALYPLRLKNIPDPPLVLYYRGQVPDLDSNAVIGVVGTRKASGYGLRAAKQFGYELGAGGAYVVSGMAVGIDAQAMSSALMGGGTVVGVMGCGLDQIYPRENETLFRAAIRQGCVFSEFPPGTPPLPQNFPKRNRIISGLSCGVLVVEAPEKSGAMITARLAADQGRDVFVVPANIGHAVSAGSNSLLRDGAISVTCGWDILSEYVCRYEGRLRDSTAAMPEYQEPGEETPEREIRTPARKKKSTNQGTEPMPAEEVPREETNKQDKKVIDKVPSAPYIDINDILTKCSPGQQAILKLLQQGACHVDTLVAETGLSAQEVLSSLTMLEIKGVIQRHPARIVSLKQIQ